MQELANREGSDYDQVSLAYLLNPTARLSEDQEEAIFGMTFGVSEDGRPLSDVQYTQLIAVYQLLTERIRMGGLHQNQVLLRKFFGEYYERVTIALARMIQHRESSINKKNRREVKLDIDRMVEAKEAVNQARQALKRELIERVYEEVNPEIYKVSKLIDDFSSNAQVLLDIYSRFIGGCASDRPEVDAQRMVAISAALSTALGIIKVGHDKLRETSISL